MPKYIIRLDDACPTMNHESWDRMDALLRKYGVKPLVGVIPDNQDPEFSWTEDEHFWEKMQAWEEEGYTIAMHGLHHKYLPAKRRKYFQRSHGVNTEFAGVPIEEQRRMLMEGEKILRKHGLTPTCFFAPAHTYDANTVKVLAEGVGNIRYISDGYALAPYQEAGMVFLPTICDRPTPFPVGVFTFVFHPGTMTEVRFRRLEKFLNRYRDRVTTPDCVLSHTRTSQGFIGSFIEMGMYAFRGAKILLSEKKSEDMSGKRCPK